MEKNIEEIEEFAIRFKNLPEKQKDYVRGMMAAFEVIDDLQEKREKESA